MINNEVDKSNHSSTLEALPPPVFSSTLENKSGKTVTFNARFVNLHKNRNCTIILYAPNRINMISCEGCQIKIYTKDRASIQMEMAENKGNQVDYFDLEGNAESEHSKVRDLLQGMTPEKNDMIISGDGLFPPLKKN